MQEQSFGMLVLADSHGNYDRTQIQSIYDNAGAQDSNILKHVQSSAGKSAQIEPTFISAEYGLLGRLDVLYEDKTNPNHKEVLELKSGTPHDKGMFPNHEAQTLAYDLMLRSVYPKRTGTNSILYSKATEGTPLRHVDSKKFYDKLRLLMVRNEIVANEIRLSLGNMDPLERMAHNDVKVPQFSQDLLNGFRRTYQQLSPLSLYRFMETPPAHKALIFGQTEPQFEQHDYAPIPGLNTNKNEIIARALNAKNYFLIQGPPGTGKTSTVLCNIVDQLIKKEENVLIIAFTNRAVDEICDKLDKKLNNEELLIRLGRQSTNNNSWPKLAAELKLNSNSATKYGIGVSFGASKGRNRLLYGLFEEKSWKKLAQMQNYMDLSYSVNTVKRFAIWQLIQNGLPPTDKREQRSALSRANIMFMQSVVNGILKRKDLKK